MSKFRGAGYIASLIFVVLLLSGCTAREAGQNLKNIDKGVGEMLKELQEDQQEAASDPSDEQAQTEEDEKEQQDEIQKEQGDIISEDLTRQQKKAIDEWLRANGYNRYGDSRNAIYTGGTPLFDERTGESINRYDYILKKFPNILERIE